MVAAAAGLLLASHAPEVRACGGFFCDRPQVNTPVPIAQSAEDVLFVMDRDPQTNQRRVEAHIRILYTGTAAQFSWVVPVTSAPAAVDVGTNLLFQRLEPATRPSFSVSFNLEGTCQGMSSGGGVGCGGAAGRKEAASGGVGPAGGGTPQVQVLFRGDVGPYATAIVRSDDPTQLETWLADNGYYVSADASRIIADYVAAHSAFVALRLQSGQDVSAIRPIVLRFAAEEACLPLKLTAIAATPDLRINVWVLGDARAVPLGYTEIGVNAAKIDWFNSGSNYDQLLREAADEAGGNAFGVEYAQPSGTVAGSLAVSATQIATLAMQRDPASYASLLATMGFPITGEILDAFRRYVPLPQQLADSGVTEAAFYANLQMYWGTDRVLFAPFDPVALTAALDTTAFQPLAQVGALFATHPFLTRLATFISPEEMTRDPLFVTNPDLPAVSARHMAVANVQCGEEDYDFCHAPVRLRIEDGRDVWYRVPAGTQSCNGQATPAYDRKDLDALPSSDAGWRRDPQGNGALVLDNSASITGALQAHNAAASAAAPGGCGCSVRGRSRHIGLGLAAAAAIGALGMRRRRRRGGGLTG